MSAKKIGYLIPTTFIMESQKLYEEPIDERIRERLVKLYQDLNQIALSLNAKQTGIHTLQEFLTGEVFFASSSNTNPRPISRIVVDFGALPNATSKSVAHNLPLDDRTLVVDHKSWANNIDGTSSIPIPFATPIALNENISLEITDTDVIITTGIDRTDYTDCYVVISYINR
jgi:hypothetical protein